MRVFWMILLGAVAALPQAADGLVRFGPNAGSLNDADLAAIRALPEVNGRAAWAIRASEGWGGWGAEVFFPADHVEPDLRRGSMLAAVARNRRDASPSVPRPWSTSYMERWAQVPRPGSDPDVLEVPRDLNRPFRIRAELSDADLIAIVRLIRSSPTVPATRTWPPDASRPPIRVRGDWPILLVRDAEQEGGIYVAMIGEAPRENTGQAMRLERSGDGWVITFVGTWWGD